MQKIEIVRSLVVEIHDERLAQCAQEWETAQAAATAATARRIRPAGGYAAPWWPWLRLRQSRGESPGFSPCPPLFLVALAPSEAESRVHLHPQQNVILYLVVYAVSDSDHVSRLDT